MNGDSNLASLNFIPILLHIKASKTWFLNSKSSQCKRKVDEKDIKS